MEKTTGNTTLCRHSAVEPFEETFRVSVERGNIMSGYVFGLLTAMVVAFIATPYVKKLAIKIGAVDAPNDRKVHTKIMPRMGGLAIFIGFVVALFIFLKPLTNEMLGIFIGGTIVLITGILDDKYQLSPKWKLLGQII